MKLAIALIAAFLITCTSGCIFRTLNPLFSEKEAIIEPWLEGRWEVMNHPKEGDSFLFTKNEDSTYLVKMIVSERFSDSANVTTLIKYDTLLFTGTTGRLDGSLYLDMVPIGVNMDPNEKNTFYNVYFLSTHTVYRLIANGNTMVMQSFKYKEFEENVLSKKVKVETASYYTGKDNNGKDNYELVVIAKTKNLQKFIKEYSKKPDVFDTSDTLKKSI